MAKTKLTILLIKADVCKSKVLKKGVSIEKDLSLSTNKIIIYYKKNSSEPPSWIEFFGRQKEEAMKNLQVRSASAVVLYLITVKGGKKRIFTVCFGYGRTLIAEDAIERRFGLLVTLNSINPKTLRSIDTTTLDAIPRNNRIQLTKASQIVDFNIDFNKDMLKAITAKSSNGPLSGTLTGSDSLSVTTENKYDEMEEFLKECFSEYSKNKYKTAFEWIDRMEKVKDKDIIKNLQEELLKELNNDSSERVWISIPDIIDYESGCYFKINSKGHYFDIDVDIVKSNLSKYMPFKLCDIKNKFKVDCISSEDEEKGHWSLYKCINADIDYDGDKYLLNEGTWYKFDSRFVGKIEGFYKRQEIADIDLPCFKDKDEEKYNKRVVSEHKEEYFLMDRLLVQIDGSSIEVCDIYTKKKQFIHVKRYRGSLTLSHLFNQGLISAECFADNDERAMMRKQIKEKDESLGSVFSFQEDDSINLSQYTIIYAIIKKDTIKGKPPEIPFFSKVSYYAVANRLMRYGYKVKLLGIEDNHEEECTQKSKS